MPVRLSTDEIKERLSDQYTSRNLDASRKRRLHNIEEFNKLDRDGLQFEKVERRLYLHKTQMDEDVFIQYPGKESDLQIPMIYDFRPRIMLKEGGVVRDFTFGDIWDVFDKIAKRHVAYLSFVASLIYDMGYLNKYNLSNKLYKYDDVKPNSNNEIVSTGTQSLEWYRITEDEDLWYSLNDRIEMIDAFGSEISFEAFMIMVDLLFQNEDCKYYYKNVVLGNAVDYKNRLNNGRNSSSHSNLYMLNYLQGNEKISALVNAFQKGKGVASFRKTDYSIVTNGMVINIDVQNDDDEKNKTNT